MRPKIYVDLDDTVADFKESAEKLLSRPLKLGCRDLLEGEWQNIDRCKDFFYNLKPRSDSRALMDKVLSYSDYFDVAFLSSTTLRSTKDRIAVQKQRWVDKHFPDIPLYLVQKSIQKQYYCNRFDILIDDKPDVIFQWGSKGGLGIQFEEAKKAIFELETLCTIILFEA
jgi:5'(3')-deoxyribonucleotidase